MNATLANAKHEHFAQLVSNGESATRAYEIAGYKGKGSGQSANRLLKDAKICARIAHLRAAKEAKHEKVAERVVKEAGLDKAWVLERLTKIVGMGMAADPVVDNEGQPIGEYKANLAGANKALELIGKELGMFIERKEVRTGALDDLPRDQMKALRDELARLVAADASGPDSGRAGATTH